MAKFCGSCGAQLGDASSFCLQCGAPQSATPQSQPPQPPPAQSYAPSQPAYTPVDAPQQAQYAPVNPSGGAQPSYSGYPAAPVAKKSGSGVKIVLAILAVLFVGAVVMLGGLFYVGHRVVNKIKTAAAEKGMSLPSGDSSAESASASTATHTDYCALLNKEDVGAAIGVPIVATQSTNEGCSYLAKGTQADMTARHVPALASTRGADRQTQDQAHQMAGTLFKALQEENKEPTSDANGNVPVLAFSIDTTGAREQMQLNSKVLGVLGPNGSTAISGIGDEAFDSSGAMMFVRKGDKLIRIIYTTCPCNTEAIKPLARKLADAI